jgi:hypothetical protein
VRGVGGGRGVSGVVLRVVGVSEPVDASAEPFWWAAIGQLGCPREPRVCLVFRKRAGGGQAAASARILGSAAM